MKAVRDWSQSEGICFKQNEKNWCPNQSTMTYSPDLRLLGTAAARQFWVSGEPPWSQVPGHCSGL